MSALKAFRQIHMLCSMLDGERVYKHDPDCSRPDAKSFADQFRNEGAAVAFGLMGMAEAIRRTDTLRRLVTCLLCGRVDFPEWCCPECGTSPDQGGP